MNDLGTEVKTQRVPDLKNITTCSLIVNVEPIKRLQYPDIYNASCTIHAITIPSESAAIILTAKDENTRDEALMKVAEAAECLIDQLGWEVNSIKVVSPETLGG